MSRDSEVMSEHSSSARLGSDDDKTSQSRVEYLSDGSLVSERESTSDPLLRKLVLLGDIPGWLFLLATS
nr:hypothetical protein CFP56_62592 [Quercus suber]